MAMTVDLILHGVPNGQDMWGVNDDTHYFSTFYVQKDEKEFLNLEVRKVSGKSYCYYNYLKYNGVTASDERAGAYIGITLRFDAYYKDITNIYHTCEIIYNNLLNAIFTKNGDNIKFKISKFEEMNSELNELKKKTINLINLSASSKDFIPISDSFFKCTGNVVKAFLLDCTPDNVMQALIKYGKVEISKYYPSINETKKLKGVEDRFSATITQKDKELQSVYKQHDDLQKDQNKLQSLLEDAKKEISKLNKLISEKDGIIKKNEEIAKEAESLKKKDQELKNSLQEKAKEIERLKVELNQFKDTRQISDLVKEIKAPLNTLATVAGRQLVRFPDDNNDNPSEDGDDANSHLKISSKKTNTFLKSPTLQVIKVVLLVIILCSSLYCVYKINNFDIRDEKKVNIENASYIEEQEISTENDIIQDSVEISFENINETTNDNSKNEDKGREE